MTKVINLLGGSGLGKSTTAADLFAHMKKRNYKVELVREYVKELAWAGIKVGPFGQSVIYGRQLERETDLYNKVDYIITDSPLLLCPVYQKYYQNTDILKEVVLHDMRTANSLGVEHLNFLLERRKPFNQDGRYETEKQAKEIDQNVREFLESNKINYVDASIPDEQRVDFIIDYIDMI